MPYESSDIMSQQIELLPVADVLETLDSVDEHASAVMLDPWYNRGVGGVREDYDEWLQVVVARSFRIADHVFVWGFPDIVCRVLGDLPEGTSLTAWLTWYYKNCPSVQRGWRSAQYTCLHLSREGASVYPQHFMNDTQRERYDAGRMRFIPGPSTVIEAPLNIGFIGKAEQTGHPAQKPVGVIEPLVKMSSKEDELVVDPMCGAGTTGVACVNTSRRAILCDVSTQYMEITRERLAAIE